MDAPKNFERARNVDLVTRWAGDPEMWGGSQSFPARVRASSSVHSSPQLLRAQTHDLIAIAWDLFVTWSATDVVLATDQFDLYLEVSIGTGHSTSLAYFFLSSKPAGAPPSTQNPGALATGWFPDPRAANAGVAISLQPVVAAALSARALVNVKHAGGQPDHNITFNVNAHCAPRSWVP